MLSFSYKFEMLSVIMLNVIMLSYCFGPRSIAPSKIIANCSFLLRIKSPNFYTENIPYIYALARYKHRGGKQYQLPVIPTVGNTN